MPTKRQIVWDILYPFVFILLCIVIASVAGIIIAGVVTGQRGTDPDVLIKTVPHMTLLITLAAYVIALAAQYRVLKNDRLRLGVPERKWGAAGIVFACIMCVCAAFLWSSLIEVSGLQEIFTLYTSVAEASFEGQNIFLLILTTVIVGPVCEEVIFRVMVFRRARHYMSLVPAMLISSVLFGVYHLNMIQLIYAFGLGMLFSWMYEKSGTILLPVLIHMGANLLAVFSVPLQDAAGRLTGADGAAAACVILAAAGAVSLVILIILIKKRRRTE